MSRPARILVVDDEPRNVKLLEALLVISHYTVVTAGNGEEALAKASEGVDLILLDVMMPELDGFETLRRLRARAETRLVPVVLITALQETEDRIKGITAGCDDFISKPFDQQEVLARVKTLLTLSFYRSLLDDKERFEYVIQHIDDGIVVLDRLGRTVRVNRRAEELLMLDPHALPTDWLADVRRRFTITYPGELAQDVLARGVTFDLVREETDNTRPLVLEARSSVVREPGGEISSVVIILRDVTDLRREELMKADFLSLVSHKLRTPIAVIQSHISILHDGILGPLNNDQRQGFETIIHKISSLTALVDNLLTFTTIYSQAIDPHTEPIPFATSLPSFLQRAMAGQPETVALEIAPIAQDVLAQVHPIYLNLLLSNLIDNAIKFNNKPNPRVSIAAARRGDWIELSVSDNGRGIPPEEHSQLFRTFYQGEKYFTGNVEGAGLGLALVKRLVNAYGGEIRLVSKLGDGTTVTLTLPASQPSTK